MRISDWSSDVCSSDLDAEKVACTQFEQADNMTGRQGALSVLSNGRSSERVAALDIFYNRYHDNALVLDKWFQTQALASRDDTVDQIVELAAHKDFTLANPNRARALYGAFAANQYGCHHISGKGYRLVTDAIIALDKLHQNGRANARRGGKGRDSTCRSREAT